VELLNSTLHLLESRVLPYVKVRAPLTRLNDLAASIGVDARQFADNFKPVKTETPYPIVYGGEEEVRLTMALTSSPPFEEASVPFRAGGFRATFPVAPGRVSGPVTPTPRGARSYGLKALGGLGCVESVCSTGYLRFAPQGRHSPSGHHKAPSWRACPQGS